MEGGSYIEEKKLNDFQLERVVKFWWDGHVGQIRSMWKTEIKILHSEQIGWVTSMNKNVCVKKVRSKIIRNTWVFLFGTDVDWWWVCRVEIIMYQLGEFSLASISCFCHVKNRKQFCWTDDMWHDSFAAISGMFLFLPRCDLISKWTQFVYRF